MTTTTLKTVVFLGSARNVLPPWGGDKRLGDRIYKHVVATLKERAGVLGDLEIKHDVTVYDPLEVFGDGGALEESGGELQIPTFFQKPEAQSDKLKDMITAIKGADCYILVTPEYNHSVPPALSSLLGHFGGSNYSCKPSAIVTYSPGPWGGMRAAVALRPLLSELGCLPVSKLTAFPSAQDMFNEDGTPKDPANRMLKQLPAQLNQLEWMAVAMKRQRDLTGTC